LAGGAYQPTRAAWATPELPNASPTSPSRPLSADVEIETSGGKTGRVKYGSPTLFAEAGKCRGRVRPTRFGRSVTEFAESAGAGRARRAMYPSPLSASTSALAFFAEGSGFGLKTEPSRPQKDEGAPPPPRPVYSHHTGPASDARGQPRPHRACPRAREVGKFCDQISHREQTHRRTVLLPQV